MHLFQLSLNFDLIGGRANPSDMVLLVPLNKIDSFQDIGDVIYPSFLHIQNFHRVVEVKALLVSCHQEIDEFFGQLNEAVLLATLLV